MPLASASASVRDPAAWQLGGTAGSSLAEAEAFCRRIARQHYENFTVATRLMPPHLRQHLANVYAFARWSDDLADEAADLAAAAQGLADWRRQTEACWAGQAEHPVFVALAETVRRTALPLEPFLDLLDAFDEDRRFDAAGVTVRYETRGDLEHYCRRSAAPVGRIVLVLEGCRDPALVPLSDSICTGLQLVNFWQDVKRDRLAGRVYLPREDMDRHGVDEAMLDAPTATRPLRELIRAEVAWARRCFDSGAPLVDRAPPALRPAIRMFVGGGRALADALDRADGDTLSRRPTVGRWTKLALAGRAWWGVLTRPRGQT